MEKGGASTQAGAQLQLKPLYINYFKALEFLIVSTTYPLLESQQ